MAAQMTEDQSLLKDAAERYLRDSYDFNGRRDRIAEGVYSDPGQWQAFAEMGWLALPIPEEFGGLIGLEAADFQPESWYNLERLNRPDLDGGNVASAVVSGLCSPTAPDEYRWETLWG